MNSPPPPDAGEPEGDNIRRRQRLSDDVQWTLPDDMDLDTDLTVAPIDPDTESARRKIREFERATPRPVEDEPEPFRFQFTLRQFMVANMVLAVLLALMRALAPGMIAGAVGVAAFSFVVFVHFYQPDEPALYTASWVAIILYTIIAAAALLFG